MLLQSISVLKGMSPVMSKEHVCFVDVVWSFFD
jgi:hypothetical protein